MLAIESTSEPHGTTIRMAEGLTIREHAHLLAPPHGGVAVGARFPRPFPMLVTGSAHAHILPVFSSQCLPFRNLYATDRACDLAESEHGHPLMRSCLE